MSRKTGDTQRVLEDNQRMAATIAKLQRQERQLATTNKMQRTDIESLKKRLEQFRTENDDLLEKLAELKLERAKYKRQLDEQMKQATGKLQQLQDSRKLHPNNEETRQQLEEAGRKADGLQRQLDAEIRRYAELERVNAELQSRLQGVQLQASQSPVPKTDKSPVLQVCNMQWKQQLENQASALTRELTEARQRLIEQVDVSDKVKRNTERLVHEKVKLEENTGELSSSLDNVKRENATSEQQKETFLEQLDKLKRALEACSITEEEQNKQLQSVEDKKQELEQLVEQLQAEQSSAKRTEKKLRDELEKMNHAENEKSVKQVELKRQLDKAQQDYNTLSRKTQQDIERLKHESKEKNEEVCELKKINLQLANNERQLKAELEETEKEAENRAGNLQRGLDTLRIELQTSDEVRVKLRKERDEMLEQWVPKKYLEKMETEQKELRTVMEETERTIQKLQDEQDALQRQTQETEQELRQEIEKLRSELKIKEEQLEKTAEQSLELENKHEKLKQSYNEKEKLSKEHEKLEQTIKEQQEKIQTIEAHHLVEKEHVLKTHNEKEKELKKKMTEKESEIRAETDKLKSKCEQLVKTHEENLRKKEEETKCQIMKLKVEIDERNKLVEAANEKNKELQQIIDGHVSQTNELKTLRSANAELKGKVGKLERAVLRLRLQNDELRESKEYISKNDNVKELVGERTPCIGDLQLQVDMLRQELEERSKSSPRRSETPADAAVQSLGVDNRLLGQMAQLLKTTAQDSKRQVANSSTLAKELETEREKVRAGSERIAQLERWLDTIFNDEEFSIGQSTVSGGAEQRPLLPPLNGASNAPAVGKLKIQTTSRPSDRSSNNQKQTSKSKR